MKLIAMASTNLLAWIQDKASFAKLAFVPKNLASF